MLDSTETDTVPSLGPIVNEAMNRFKLCAQWEATARFNFLSDLRFANGDADNGYQWPNQVRQNRDTDQRPCLTMNVVRQHNLQIVNEAKQNKSSVEFQAVGGGATKAAADLIQAMFRREEYLSNAQTAYETACEFQVAGGIGWIRVVTEYAGATTFNQCFRIKRVKDPLSVYMDMSCQEKDCSDARYGFVFDLVPDEELLEAYPRLRDLLPEGQSPLGTSGSDGAWGIKEHTRVCEYFRRVRKSDKLISFIDPRNNQRVELLKSKMPPEIAEAILLQPLTKWRWTESWEVQWYLIVGQKIVDKTIWPGQYIPLVRVLGEETVIDGVLDRKGHTRSMKDAQRMYNYNAALALDTQIPTPTGWTTMGQLQAGDWIFGRDGNPVQVARVHPVKLEDECYKITFDNGQQIITDAGHIWRVEERGKRKAATYGWKNVTRATAELESKKHFVHCAKPLILPEADLIVPPYLLGLWLGDGSTDGGRIHGHLDDIDAEKELISALGFECGETNSIEGHGGAFTVKGLVGQLRKAGVLGNKHIPVCYLRASRAQRLAVLQGLMDSDGHFAKAVNQCVFVNINPDIIRGFLELCGSLGIKCTVDVQPAHVAFYDGHTAYISKPTYRVQFTADIEVPVFALHRKAAQQTAGRKQHWRRTKRHGVLSVERVPPVPVRCIELDTPDHLYLCTLSMIPTHNSSQVEFVALQGKTPWIAAAKAIEEFEGLWNTANLVNHSVLPYNNRDDEGNEIEQPKRTEPPQASQAYEQGMTTAFNQMMMTSGQWQNQMGMGGNERTGEAISRRQEQGYTAVFHFQNNYAEALKSIGKHFLDVFPIIYDTKQLITLRTQDGEDFDLTLDPASPELLQQQQDQDGKIVARVLNPRLGKFDVQADVGPAYGTRREETVRAMTLLLTQAPGLVPIIGDLLLGAMNFKEAQEAAQRLKRMVPPQALGKGPTMQEATMQKQVEQLQTALAKALEQGSVSKIKLAGKDELRDIEVFDAQTKRLKVILDGLVAGGQINQAHAQMIEDSMHAHLDRVADQNEGEDHAD